MNRVNIVAIAISLVTAAFVACGGSSGGSTNPAIDAPGSGSNHDDSGTNPGSYDFQCGGTTPCTLDKVCCTHTTDPNAVTFSCDDKASCPAADQISCDGPDDCTNGDVCCGVSVPNGDGSFPSCGATSIGATCMTANACKTKLVTNNCDDTTKVQLCHSNDDCDVESNNSHCCTFGDGATLTFCTDLLTANAGGGTCM